MQKISLDDARKMADAQRRSFDFCGLNLFHINWLEHSHPDVIEQNPDCSHFLVPSDANFLDFDSYETILVLASPETEDLSFDEKML